jgi:polysaccharide export outer membrane protein
MRNLILFFLFAVLLSSCKILKSNLMLKTPKDYDYDKLIDSLGRLDYKIAPNDAIQYKVSTNDGFKLIDLSNTTGTFRSDLDVIVESDGNVKMPLLGRISVAGLTVRDAEKLMEEKYSEYYVKPFVNLKVINKRVIVFPGNTGQARVLPLINNNTTVMEAIAAAGGIPEDGKAYKIKLIRSNADPAQKPYVYLMDLSRIEGVTLGYTKVQANDIIYVEPRYRPFRTIATEIAPVVTLLTTILLLVQFSTLR